MFRTALNAFYRPILLIFWLFSAIGAADESPKWSVEKLNGVISYHDGANCFNAVLAAMGYTDNLMYVGGGEFDFFRHKFCAFKTTGNPQKNNIITFAGSSLYHSAIYLDDAHVFHKGGLSGLNHPLIENRKVIGLSTGAEYRIESLNEVAKNFTCGRGTCLVDTYQCDPPEEVKKTLAQCDQQFETFPVKKLYAELNALTFDQNLTAAFSETSIRSIEQWANALEYFRAQDFCSMYLLVKSYSIYGYLTNLRTDIYITGLAHQTPDVSPPYSWKFQFWSATDHFRAAFKKAMIESKRNMKDESSREIFQEMGELYPGELGGS